MNKAKETASLLDSATRSAFDKEFVHNLVVLDETKAIEYFLNESRIATYEPQLTGSLLAPLFLDEPQTLIEMIEHAPPGDARDSAAAFMVRRLSKTDPAAARLWLNTIENTQIKSMASRSAKSNR